MEGAVLQKPLTLSLKECMHTEKNGWTMKALGSACWHALLCLKGNCVGLAWGHKASPEARLGAAPQVGLHQQIKISHLAVATVVACRCLQTLSCNRKTNSRQPQALHQHVTGAAS